MLPSDRDDTNSQRTESALLACAPISESAEGVRVFTVGNGDEANLDLLTRIASRTRAESYEDNPDIIEETLLYIFSQQ